MKWLLLATIAGAEAILGPSAPDDASDLDWVGRIARGDRDALAALYDRHARSVYSLALRIVRNQPDAEEVVQDVFAQAWRTAGRYDRRRGAVPAWLLMMTRSRAIDRLRRGRGEPPRQDDERVWGVLAAGDTPPDERAAHGDRVARLRTALEALPFLQRAAIELAFFEGLTHTEVAARLEQPLGTVKTRIRLGLLKLREALEGGTP